MTRSFHKLLSITLSVLVLTAAIATSTRAQDQPTVDLTVSSETVTLDHRTGTITVTEQ